MQKYLSLDCPLYYPIRPIRNGISLKVDTETGEFTFIDTTTKGEIKEYPISIGGGSGDGSGSGSGSSITYTAGTLVINKANMATPTVSIDTNGKVTWGNITGATSYQISFDNSNWTTATSGSEYIDLTSSGTKTAYVRAVSTSTNYNTPSSAERIT